MTRVFSFLVKFRGDFTRMSRPLKPAAAAAACRVECHAWFFFVIVTFENFWMVKYINHCNLGLTVI